MNPEHNLVLTGFMGTGKTTVGLELARKLGMEFVDTDQLIESRHGPVSAIFELRGEQAFRELEREVARELGKRNGIVIATGGRMMLDPVNFKELSRNGRIFCLVATPDEILHRLSNDPLRPDRPLLKVADPKQRIVELLTEREVDYESFPQLATDHAGPDAIADEVVDLWRGHDNYDIASPGGGYPYTVGVGILPFLRQLASLRGPVVVITDDVVRDLYAPSLGEVDLVIALPAGRPQKTIDSVQVVYDALFDAGIDKTATAVSLGTSILGDVAGFVAATYLRGIDLVHCPTNLIAMVDTSVGGKGRARRSTRPQPRRPLQTAEGRARRCGNAADSAASGLFLRSRGSGQARSHCRQLAARPDRDQRVAAGGESPSGNAGEPASAGRPGDPDQDLDRSRGPIRRKGAKNVSQSRAHIRLRIEHASRGAVNHGEAVAMGLVAASRLSEIKGYATAGLADRVQSIVERIGLSPTLPPYLAPGEILAGMDHDKKRREARLRFVLLRGVGDPFVTDEVTPSEVLSVLEGMRDAAGVETANSVSG